VDVVEVVAQDRDGDRGREQEEEGWVRPAVPRRSLDGLPRAARTLGGPQHPARVQRGAKRPSGTTNNTIRYRNVASSHTKRAGSRSAGVACPSAQRARIEKPAP